MTTRPKICNNRHYQRKRGVLFIHGIRDGFTGGIGNMGNQAYTTMRGLFQNGTWGTFSPRLLLSFVTVEARPAGRETHSLARRDNLGWDDEGTIVNQQIFSNHITELQGSCTIGYHILFSVATCM
ncbi:hypothetical protein GQ607_003789 [Colletotrichum asianum]|uniref:Uncharacterized protein n=1 Tax=Colletotrichum asianum TaxID=702518 RepID=A0A8H3WNI8_9PEZI|nr:hypothetical protein GQ607_003789 [Colletotrichum asianum]